MIVDINSNTIETDDIENVTPVFNSYEDDQFFFIFKVYMKTSYFWVKDLNEDVANEKHRKLIDIWKQGKTIVKI